MDELKKRIQRYWCSRSGDFARLRAAELENGIGDWWEDELRQVIPSKKSLRILDAGTGSGFFSILLAGMGHCVTGIDLSARMIDEAKRLAWKAGVQAEFQAMDAEFPKFEDETFDVVVTRNLTWTLEQPKEAYSQWLRVLKPGGLLVNFDADYGKEVFSKDTDRLPAEHAHKQVGRELLEECDAINCQLPLKAVSRPQWDLQILQELGAEQVEVDFNVSRRVYREINAFYNPTPMFRIVAKKGD